MSEWSVGVEEWYKWAEKIQLAMDLWEGLVCFVINLAILIKHLEFIVFMLCSVMWLYAALTLLPQEIHNQSNSVINN